MSAFRISKSIPPPKHRGGGRKIYPFDEMQIGDSFAVKGLDAYKRAQVAAAQHARRHGVTFTTRRNGDGGRIWRVE